MNNQLNPPKHQPASQFLEPLEQRIAPAGLNEAGFDAAPVASSILLTAGHGISTANSGGSYLMYVQQGQALVFTTDLNANNKVDANEITGIAAGDGLKLISFVDINGDIVTNLRPDGHLTDSDGNSANGYDGKIVLNSHIDSITMRSVTQADLNPALYNGQNTPHERIARSNYSINGSIYAGGGIGSETSPGLLIDTTGFSVQKGKFTETFNYGSHDTDPTPNVGYIYTGSAVSGKTFSFGTSPDFGNKPTESLRGTLVDFLPAAGQAGGDVIGVKSTGADANNPPKFYIGGIHTGDGGFGAKGGDIKNVALNGDIGTFQIIAGDGGRGVTGGNGGSVLNFSAKACETSQVEIRTGNGGFGLLGTGGSAGQISFSTGTTTTTNTDGTTTTTTSILPVEFYGYVTIGLGNGGDAFGNASAGTSVSTGKFTLPDLGGIVTPAATVSTTRVAGDFDRPASFDFNGDGFSDMVYITDNPSQLKALLGNGTGGFLGSYILDGSSYASINDRYSPVAVADFNGDGLMDVVTASSAGDSFTGLKVFLNRGYDPLHPGDSAYWLGFGDARYSPIPYQYDTLASAAVNIVTGDFDDDGITDVGLVSNYYLKGLVYPYVSQLTIMSGITGADGAPDGYFAANYDKGAETSAKSSPSMSLIEIKGTAETSVIVKATATTLNDNKSDVIAVMGRAGTFASELISLKNGGIGIYSVTGTPGAHTLGVASAFDSGDYINRKQKDGAWTGYTGSPIPISLRDFAIVDANADGFFDPVVLGEVGQGTAAAIFQGSASGFIFQPTFDDKFGTGHYGILIAGSDVYPTVTGSADAYTIYKAVSLTSTVLPNSDYFSIGYTAGALKAIDAFVASGFGQSDLEERSGPDPLVIPPIEPPLPVYTNYSVAGEGQTECSIFDTFYPLTPTPVVAAGQPQYQGEPQYQGMSYFTVINLWELETQTVVQTGPPLPTTTETSQYFMLSPNRLLLTAGDGGVSLLGTGGHGGSVGTGMAITLDAKGAATSSVVTTGYDSGTLTTGKGGSGFTAGGQGGSFSGVASVFYSNPDAYMTTHLVTGDGGSSMRGTGGNAGGFSQVSIRGLKTNINDFAPLMYLRAGDGGFGLKGGDGGSLTGRGNATQGLEDAGGFKAYTLAGGSGGEGISSGGAGGTIRSFLNLFKVETDYGQYENVATAFYYGGNGGDSASGAGGVGGSILNSSPSSRESFLTGVQSIGGVVTASELFLGSGHGGSGITGGAGGDVSDFVMTESTEKYPRLANVLAGDGGDGVTGNGGRGGSLSNVTMTSAALDASDAATITRVVAGNGGDGSASAGGIGGTLSNVKSTAAAGAIVGIAGDGGDGLKAGGAGGDVKSTKLNSSGLEYGRVVVFAGTGGDGHGVTQKQIALEATALPIYQGIIAMGAVNGIGGNGGSITGFTQPTTIETSTDLTAGNGGNTVNWGLYTFGRPGTQAPGIGAGGSISNVDLLGDAGKISSTVAIKSYGPAFASDIRNFDTTQLSDKTDGYVGVVVGSQGTVRNGEVCAASKAGSVSTFTARNIMSMVAGSVDRLAAITSISGLKLQNGGTVLGAYKDTPVAHESNTPVYFDSNGAEVSTAQVGGALMDGAILAKAWTGDKPQSSRVFIG